MPLRLSAMLEQSCQPISLRAVLVRRVMSCAERAALSIISATEIFRSAVSSYVLKRGILSPASSSKAAVCNMVRIMTSTLSKAALSLHAHSGVPVTTDAYSEMEVSLGMRKS